MQAWDGETKTILCKLFCKEFQPNKDQFYKISMYQGDNLQQHVGLQNDLSTRIPSIIIARMKN